MAGDEGFKLASAYVEVKPDLSGFGAEAKADVAAATKDLKATAKLQLDIGDATAKAAQIQARMDRLNAIIARPTVTPQMARAQAEIDALQAELDHLGEETVTPKVEAQIADAQAKLDEVKARLDQLQAKDTEVRVKASADLLAAEAQLDRVNAKLDELGAKDAQARVSVDTGDSIPKLEEVDHDLNKIDGRTANAKVNVSSSGSGLNLLSGGLTSPASIAGIGLGGGALLPALPGALAGGAAAAGTLGLAIAGVSKALGDYQTMQHSAATATGQSAASQVSAANTIRTAQQAVSQAETQQAHDAITSAEQIRNAQQGVAQAQTQAAHDAITSAEAIKNAQQGVATATQQAAQSEISAEQQLATAQYNEQQAQQNLTSARQQAILTLQALNNAEADTALGASQARLNLLQAEQNQATVDANAKSTALQRAQAALSVKEAEQALKEAIQGRTNAATAAQKADKQGVAGNPQVLAAEHAAKQAKQAVADAQRNLANAEKAGAQAIAKAEQSLADAIRSASWQRVTDAQNVGKAQQGLADASRNASWTQQADAQRVSNAQAGLKAAYASAGVAAGKTSAATRQYAKDMAALTPAGRQFVNSITGMMGALHSLEGVAQKALLPGLTGFLKGVKSLGPEISKEVAAMGGLLSRGFSVIGKEMQTSGFQKTLQTLFTEGNRFISILGPSVNKLVLAFMDMGAKGGPALTGLAKGLSAILGGFSNLFTNLGKYSGAAGSILETLGKAVGALGGPLGTVIGVLLSALAPLLKGALPLFRTLVDQIARIVKSAQPGLVGIGQALGQMLIALVPVLPSLGTLVVQLVKLVDAALLPLLPLLPQLIPPFVQLATQGLAPMTLLVTRLTPLVSILAQALSGILAVALPPLITALTAVDSIMLTLQTDFLSAVTSVSSIKNAWNDVASFTTNIWNGIASFFSNWWNDEVSSVRSFIKTIRSALSAAWDAITSTIKTAWNAIRSFFTGWWNSEVSNTRATLSTIGKVLSSAWNGIASAAKSIWNGIASFFGGFWTTLKSGFNTGVSGIKTAWDKLKQIFKDPVNFLITTVYDNGIRRFWNDVVNAVGLGKLDLPNVQPLASGGKIMQGSGPTSDDVVARVSKGETVVSAAHSKVLAPLFAAVGVPGYAAGGIPNPISGIKHLLGGAIDVAKIVAALATGNTTALKNALDALVHTSGKGNYGSLLTAVPKTLISDAIKGAAAALTGAATASGGGPGGGGPVGGDERANAALARRMYPSWGSGAEWTAWNSLEMGEAGWNRFISNSSSGAYGIPQALPYTKMPKAAWPASAGGQSNASDQIRWMHDYIVHTPGYGDPIHTYAKWLSRSPHWYDQGGWLKPGGIPVNGLRKPEAVLTPDESAAFIQLVKGLVASGSGRGGVSVHGSGHGAGGPVSVNYFGTTHPTPEQEAAMLLKLGAMIGVA